MQPDLSPDTVYRLLLARHKLWLSASQLHALQRRQRRGYATALNLLCGQLACYNIQSPLLDEARALCEVLLAPADRRAA